MGIKPVLNLLQQAGKIAGRYMDDVARIAASKGDDAFGALVRKADDVNLEGLRLAPQALEDTAKLTGVAPKMKLKFFTPDEILDMKPSTFKKILEARTDIPEYINKDLLTPEKLNLYDELMGLEEIQRMPKDKLENALKTLFGEYNLKGSDTSAQLEIIPDLVRKGFDLETLAKLAITQSNKNQIETVLSRKDFLAAYWDKKAAKIIESAKKRNLSESSIERELNLKKRYFDTEGIRGLLKHITDDNIKYLDECIDLTNNPTLLPYWTDDSARIIKEICVDGISVDTMDRLFRRGHNYSSVKHILGEEKLTGLTARLLEFKEFDALKDIGLDDLEKLTVQQRKDFLNGFISAISPKEAMWRKNNGLMDISLLQSKMKIFKELDTTSDEAFVASHKKIIDRILNSIPEEERKIIDTVADTKAYRRDYRLANPIPTLVDDIETVLPTKTREIKGRKIRVAVMEREPDFGIATHRIPNAEAIKTVEALEITDANMLLCIGTRGDYRNRGINFNDSGYAIAVKPRKGVDWHVQARNDIDSGNNASKNIYNFENIILPDYGNHCSCIDLVQDKIKEILDLSQRQYSARMLKIKDCRTLQEVEKIDFELAKAIRKMINETSLYEGLIRPEPMGVLVRQGISPDEIDDAILDYCVRRNVPLIEVKPEA